MFLRLLTLFLEAFRRQSAFSRRARLSLSTGAHILPAAATVSTLLSSKRVEVTYFTQGLAEVGTFGIF